MLPSPSMTFRARRMMRRLACIPLSLAGIAFFLGGCAAFVSETKQEYIRVKSATSAAEIEIALEDSFIETYKNRATIAAAFTIDKVDRRPHPAFWDGDFHIAGRAPAIGLPVVAEIKNAVFEQDAVDRVRGVEGTGKPIGLAGAWRLWSEHVGKAAEVQGEDLPAGEATNPDHVFEIHPVTRVDDRKLLGSFHPVEGYRPGKAEIVFKVLENARCRIAAQGRMTTMVIPTGQFNDVEFLLEVGQDRQLVVEDGRFVSGSILDLKGNPLVRKLRMVLVKNTPPEMKIRSLRPGDRIHVFGLPRIDLSTVSWRVRHARDNPELLSLNLPYEIIIVGVYADLN